MVFNTGAALLDAIVLAVVSRSRKYLRIQDHPGCTRSSGYFRIHTLSSAAPCRRMTAWKSTIRHMPDEIADIIN